LRHEKNPKVLRSGGGEESSGLFNGEYNPSDVSQIHKTEVLFIFGSRSLSEGK